jgi:transposase
MSKPLHLAIQETEIELLLKLRRERDVRCRERLQFLNWFHTCLATESQHIASLLERSPATITSWARRYYMQFGLRGLLAMEHRGGAHRRRIPPALLSQILMDSRLRDLSVADIQRSLSHHYGYEIPYSTLHGVLRYGYLNTRVDSWPEGDLAPDWPIYPSANADIRRRLP